MTETMHQVCPCLFYGIVSAHAIKNFYFSNNYAYTCLIFVFTYLTACTVYHTASTRFYTSIIAAIYSTNGFGHASHAYWMKVTDLPEILAVLNYNRLTRPFFFSISTCFMSKASMSSQCTEYVEHCSVYNIHFYFSPRFLMKLSNALFRLHLHLKIIVQHTSAHSQHCSIRSYHSIPAVQTQKEPQIFYQ